MLQVQTILLHHAPGSLDSKENQNPPAFNALCPDLLASLHVLHRRAQPASHGILQPGYTQLVF